MSTALKARLTRRGIWRPEQVGGAVLVIQLGILFACLTRGLDYLRRDNDLTSVLSRVQDSAPLPAWGTLFIGAAVIAVIGMIGRWGTLVGVGHFIAGIAYGGIAFGLLLETGYGPGIRTPAGLFVASLIHGAFGVGTFAQLRQAEESEHPSATT